MNKTIVPENNAPLRTLEELSFEIEQQLEAERREAEERQRQADLAEAIRNEERKLVMRQYLRAQGISTKGIDLQVSEDGLYFEWLGEQKRGFVYPPSLPAGDGTRKSWIVHEWGNRATYPKTVESMVRYCVKQFGAFCPKPSREAFLEAFAEYGADSLEICNYIGCPQWMAEEWLAANVDPDEAKS